MGLREILKHENLDPKDVFDFFVNTVPDQHTATVRTEEAILISLGILNLAGTRWMTSSLLPMVETR